MDEKEQQPEKPQEPGDTNSTHHVIKLSDVTTAGTPTRSAIGSCEGKSPVVSWHDTVHDKNDSQNPPPQPQHPQPIIRSSSGGGGGGKRTVVIKNASEVVQVSGGDRDDPISSRADRARSISTVTTTSVASSVTLSSGASSSGGESTTSSITVSIRTGILDSDAESVDASASDYGTRSHKDKNKKKGKRVRPLVLKILFSISFIVLIIAIIAAVVPSATVWAKASKGITDLEDKSMNDKISAICNNIKVMMETRLGNFEKEVASSVGFANTMVSQKLDGTNATSLPLDLTYNASRHILTMLTVYGGVVESLGVWVSEGLYIVAPKSWAGAVHGFQRGYGSNCTMEIYYYLIDKYEPNWDTPLTFPIVPFREHASLSDEQWATFSSDLTLMWGNVGIFDNNEIITADLYAPLFLPDSSELGGFVTCSIAADSFISLMTDSEQDGIICTFVQNYNGTILSSTCEDASYKNGSQVVTVNTDNSTIWEVRDSASHLAAVLAGNLSEVSIFQGKGYIVAFQRIESIYGFTAITTVIGDINYFQKTYNRVQNHTERFIIIIMIVALILAGTLSVFTLGGQLQVIQRIKKISDVSVGSSASTQPRIHGSTVHPEEELDKSRGVTTNLGGFLRKINAFSRLTEIKLILEKLEWLDGKVQIVAAFVPVISKLVCRQQFSDLAILESSLSRRMGCYLFCDIENFTALCESVSPDIAAKLLELFYDTAERAAKAHKHNLLVKRLGDGIFFTWGFQLEVEKKKSSSTPLPALAYAAALRIAESVVELSRKAEALVGSEAPDWHCTLRIGITTGPALHGLLKTDTLINPDVVGAAVNFAARCQTVGKLANIKELSRQELPTLSLAATTTTNNVDEVDGPDRVVCTITSDMATHQANTHLAEQLSSDTPNPSVQMVHAAVVASKSVEAYTRYLVEDVPLQGIGKTNLSVTFVTRNKAAQRLRQHKEHRRQGHHHHQQQEQQTTTTNLN
ncbi:hypothetical protein Pelo_15950 [Pelomyxa schiedti]|nr:hypothetical protein Pelo_15950 [Pelomyxa schiedti]